MIQSISTQSSKLFIIFFSVLAALSYQLDQGFDTCLPVQYKGTETATCVSCPSNCSTCLESQCLTCAYGQMQNNQCLGVNQTCPQGQFLRTSTSTCVYCNVPFCIACTSLSQCSKCQAGFSLLNNTCVKRNDSSEGDKYIQNTCLSQYKENQGYCQEQQLCTSQSSSRKTFFEENVKSTLTYKSTLIGYSSQEVILYDIATFVYSATLFDLPYQSQEYITGAALYKNTLNVLTNNAIYTFNLDNSILISKYALSTSLTEGDLDYRQIYIQEEENQLIYVSLTGASLNIKLITFSISYSSQNSFSLTLLLKPNYLLLSSSEASFITSFVYFSKIKIIGIFATDYVYFVNIVSLSVNKSPFEGLSSISSFDSLVSREQVEGDGSIWFYLLKQSSFLTYIYKIMYQIVSDGNKDIVTVLPNLNSIPPVLNMINIEFSLGYLQIIDDVIYLLSIQSSQVQNQSAKQFGLYDVEYFFNFDYQNYYNFEDIDISIGTIQIPTAYSIINKSNSPNNSFLLALSSAHSILFFEFQESPKKINTIQQQISFSMSQNTLSLKSPIYTSNDKMLIFQLGTMIGKIELPISNQNNIQYLITQNEIFDGKDQIFFNDFDVNMIIVPDNINQSNSPSKYSFIILQHTTQKGFSVVSSKIKQNEDSVIKLYRFFYFTNSVSSLFTNDEVITQKSCFDEDNGVLYVVTNRVIYSIKIDTLELVVAYKVFLILERQGTVFCFNEQVIQPTGSASYFTSKIQFNNQGQPDLNTYLQMMEVMNPTPFGPVFFQINENNPGVFYLLTLDIFQQQFQVFYGNQVCYIFDDNLMTYTDIQFYSETEIILFSQNGPFYEFFKLDFSQCPFFLIVDQSIKQFIPMATSLCKLIPYQSYSVCIYMNTRIITNDQTISVALIDWRQNKLLTETSDLVIVSLDELYTINNFELNNNNIGVDSTLYFTTNKNKVTAFSTTSHYFGGQILLNQVNGQSELTTKTTQTIGTFTDFSNRNPKINLLHTLDQVYYRIFWFDQMTHFGTFFISENTKQDNLQLWQDSLIFRDQSRAKIFRKMNKMLTSFKIQIDKFVQAIDELGLLIVIRSNDILFLTEDQLSIIYTIRMSNTSSSQIKYSKKYFTLIVFNLSTVTFYPYYNNFGESHSSTEIPNNQYPQCLPLDNLPMIACDRIGLYDFKLNQWYLNSDINIISAQRENPFLTDNEFYVQFNNIQNIIIFNYNTKQYSSKKKISFQSMISPELYLIEGIQNQILAIDQNQECGVYQIPLLTKLVYFSSSTISGFKCLYNQIQKQLIVRSSSQVSIYSLPYATSNAIIKLPTFDLNSDSQIIVSRNQIIFSSQITFLDETPTYYISTYNLNTGYYFSQNYILSDLDGGPLKYWEDKNALFNNYVFLQLGDEGYGWSSDIYYSIVEYSPRFNYFYAENNVDGILSLQIIDPSESFIVNQKSMQLFNVLNIDNNNLYKTSLTQNTLSYYNSNLDSSSETVLFLDSINSKISQLSLVNLQTTIYYDLIGLSDYVQGSQAEKKTHYEIYEILDVGDSKTKYIALYLKCKIFLLQQNKLISVVDLSDSSCSFKVTSNSVWYLSQQSISLSYTYLKNSSIITGSIQLSSPIDDTDFYVDSTSNWVFVVYQKSGQASLIQSQFIKVDMISNQIEKSFDKSFQYSSAGGVSRADFFNLSNETYLFISNSDSTSLLYHTSFVNSQIVLDELYNYDFQCGVIKQFAMTVKQLLRDPTLTQVSIYITCSTRISLILGLYNPQSKQFNQIGLKVQQPIHTRLQHKIKLLNSNFITLITNQQITIYSESLQYLGRIEETTFVSLTDITTAPDGLTYFVTDYDAVYIYSISQQTDSNRWIQQSTFSYITPKILSVKYLYQDKPYMIAFGIDVNGFFQLNYIQSGFESSSSNSCFISINNYVTQQEQVDQYISWLYHKGSDNSNDPFQLNLVTTSAQKIIQLPVQLDSQIDDSKAPYIKQRIYLDLDLNKQLVEIAQYNNYAKVKKNLLSSLKISNGSFQITSDLTFDNMASVIFRNVTIILQSENQISFLNVSSVKFDNCFLQINVRNGTNQNSANFANLIVFTFSQVSSISITNFNILNQQFQNISLFKFSQCGNTLIDSISMNDIVVTSNNPLILFSKQQNTITISNLIIQESTVQALLSFQTCQVVQLNKIDIKNLNYNLSSRFLQHKERSLNTLNNNNLPLITVQCVYQSFTVSNLNILNNSKFYQLLAYQNWIYDIQTVGDISQNIKKQSKTSLINLSNNQITDSIFYQNLMQIEENTVTIDTMTLINNQDSSIILINAFKQIIISTFVADSNKFQVNYYLLQVSNSLVSIQSMHVLNTIVLSSSPTPGTYFGLLEINSSDFIINDLQGKSNTLKLFYFLLINQGYQSTYNAVTTFQNVPVRSIIGSTIISTIEGGGIQAIDLSNILIKSSQISLNTGITSGGGIYANNIQQLLLTSVEISFNKASQNGGGIYLMNSDLSLSDCKIFNNTALIGGGIRYNNELIYPTFLSQDLNQLYNNYATIFGNNYGSQPTQIILVESQSQKLDGMKVIKTIEGVSSATQQVTSVQFQLIGEDGNLVNLPESSTLSGDLKNDILTYYEFSLSTDNTRIQILQQSITSSYNYTSVNNPNNHFQFTKYILNSGYSSLQQGNLGIQNTYQLNIQSTNDFNIPSQESKSIQKASLSLQFNLKFRSCQPGEIVRQVSNDFYECWKCVDNTYSFADPYSNKLQNNCQNCVRNAVSCQGNQIVPAEQYWVEENSSDVIFCLNSPSSCTQQAGSKEGCAEGYYGPLCESCDYYNTIWQDKTYAKKGQYSCTICSDTISQNTQISITIILGVAFLLYLFYQIKSTFSEKLLKQQIMYLKWCELFLISNSINLGERISFAIKILIGYFQIISIIFSFQLQIPSGFKAVQFLGSNIDITLYSLDCFFVNLHLQSEIKIVYLRLIWAFLQPLIYILLLVIIFLVVLLFSKGKQNQRWTNLFVSGLLQIFFMIYPALIQQSIGTFSCKNINGNNYVLNDIQFPCYDNEYYIINFCFSLPVIAITFIIPGLIMRKLIQNKHQLNTNPNIFLQYGYFFSEFKERFSFWEIIKIYQKMLIFVIIGIFNESAMISSILVSIIIIFYLKFQIKIQPYSNTTFNQLEYISQISAIVTILSLAINITTDSPVISIMSIALAALYNIYFFFKFLFCFSSFLIDHPSYRVILNVLLKVQKSFPKIFPKILDKNVNIIRVTKNWKTLKRHMLKKNHLKINNFNLESRKAALLKYKTQVQITNEISQTKQPTLELVSFQDIKKPKMLSVKFVDENININEGITPKKLYSLERNLPMNTNDNLFACIPQLSKDPLSINDIKSEEHMVQRNYQNNK